MKKKRNWLLLIFGLAVLLGFGQVAQAALSAAGPIDPADGFPVWYQDANALGLIPCHSPTRSPTLPATFMCLLAGGIGFDTALPVVFPFNYPGAAFYWVATASAPLGSPFATFVPVVEFALEKTFANLGATPIDLEQTVFARSRFRIDATVAGTYTITHPFGVKVFTNVPVGVKAIDFTEDIPLDAALDFTTALNGVIGPFLRWDTGYPIVIGNERFIGDPNVAHTVTGSPTGNNFVRIVGPPNAFGVEIDTVETNLFLVGGKLFNGALPTPVSVTRATYSRAAGTALGQVDVFATSLPTAALTVNGGGVIPTWPMTGDGTGRFFAHIPVTSLDPVPATLTVTADDSGNNPNNAPGTSPPVNLTDLVTITAADYSAATGQLSVTANSSDLFVPVPALTLAGFTPGILTNGVPTVFTTAAPPPSINVISSEGGSDSQKVTVAAALPAALPPVARNDAARTLPNTAVIINVLANDLALVGTLNPASVAIVTPPPGSTSINPATGAITFTPTATPGVIIFTYTVADNQPLTSNTATVTVTVAAGPLAVNDTAVTNLNTTTVINILANDTAAAGLLLNPSSVVITPPLVPHGTTAVNPGTGAVTYVPTLGYFGPDSFTYTVQDNQGTISNPATVSITVAPPGPTVNDDFATTLQGQAVVIPVLANDFGALNFTTLAILSPPAQGSTVVNPLNGTITYTPPVLFTGPMTFTYTVRNTLGFPPSNVFATVTVTVTPLTETITFGKAEFNSRLRLWTVQGTTNAPAPPNNTMTIRTGSPAGTLLGTAAVDATGNWVLNLVNSTIPYNGTVSVQSSYGTAVTSSVRPF
jgi:hypothetical protein